MTIQPTMSKMKMIISYNGSYFFGSAKNDPYITVQYALEEALSILFSQKIQSVFASRTDKGVHAIGQVVHFSHNRDSIKEINIMNFCNTHFLLKYNGNLAIKECSPVNLTFHARFDALYKEYIYIICDNNSFHSPFLNKLVYTVKNKINLNHLNECLNHIVGYHDFKAFINFDKKRLQNTYYSFILNAYAFRKNNKIFISIKGTNFYYKQIRNIIGTALYLQASDSLKMRNILLSKSRLNSGPTLAPDGLYLNKIYYDTQ